MVETPAPLRDYAHANQHGAFLQTGAKVSDCKRQHCWSLFIHNIAGQPICVGHVVNADDGETVDLGVASVAVGFAAPGSTDTISKLFSDGSSNNLQSGTFVLYGIATS